MNHKRLISLTICCILSVVPGSSVLSFAGIESETSTKAEQHFEKANDLHKAADYDAAIAEYKKVLNLSPDSKAARNAQYWIGQSYFKAGQYDAALAAFEKLLDEYQTSKIVASTKRMIERVQQAKNKKALVQVVKQGDVEELKLLISRGADVNNIKDPNGWTLLHLAAKHGHVDIAILLIEKGADINVRNEHTYAKTPLHFAALEGHTAVAELLIAKGAKVNAHQSTGHTSLHYAAYQGHVDVIKLLLSKGAKIEARDNWDMTPLGSAVAYDRPEAVKLLLDRGANIEARCWQAGPPLHVAVEHNRLEMAKLLLKRGAYIDSREGGDSTPLHTAIGKGNQDMVKLLLANGAAPWRRRIGSNLVGIAMAANKKEMVRFLVDKGFEHSAVHVAAFLGDLNEVKSYLAAGGDINARSPSWFTLLICATMGGHVAEVEFLISRGADINLKGSEGRSALGWATIRAYDDPSETRAEVARMLLHEGAEMTIPESIDGRTAWLWASLLGRKDIVEAMLAKGVDVNAKSSIYIASEGISDEGRTALHEACRTGRVAVVEVLITNGADINAKTKNGKTPISLAKEGIRRKHEQVVELLRKHGAKE